MIHSLHFCNELRLLNLPVDSVDSFIYRVHQLDQTIIYARCLND